MVNHDLITGKLNFLKKNISQYIEQPGTTLISLGRNENDNLKYDLTSDSIEIKDSYMYILRGHLLVGPKPPSSTKSMIKELRLRIFLILMLVKQKKHGRVARFLFQSNKLTIW